MNEPIPATPVENSPTAVEEPKSKAAVNKNLPSGDEDLSRTFYHGSALNLKEANQVTGETPTRIVILAGESESGKTTLLVEIYEKFMLGTFGGCAFAGSKTLVGFERRCHSSRMISGREEPATERSPEMDPEFLHLHVRRTTKKSEEAHLLFTDLSGERFKMIRHSDDETRRLKVLARADHFALLVDGANLVDTKLKQKAYEDCRSLLRSGLDSMMLGTHTFVEVIFSKWDIIQPAKVKTENSDFVDSIQERMEAEFKDKFGRLDFFRIASRAKDTKKYPLAHNLEPLFRHWVQQSPAKQAASSSDEE